MGEPFEGHILIGLKGGFKVMFVDSNGDSHEHMLGALYYLAVDFKEIRFLECFEAKVVVGVISVVV